MFYAGAVEGADRWVKPSDVRKMSDAQSKLDQDEARRTWLTLAHRRGWKPADPWSADREQVRDETLRPLYEKFNAVLWRDVDDAGTTADIPRYALARDFAELFLCADERFPAANEAWRHEHLSAAAITRHRLLRLATQASEGDGEVRVTLPDGAVRSMASGSSSVISKAVVEVFARRFLGNPALIWLSESKRQVIAENHRLAEACGLRIDASRVLPDIILADIEPREPLLVFVEVVATAGPVHEERRAALLELATGGGHDARNVAFVTAFLDRARPEFRSNLTALAMGSFAWCASEPENIIHLRSGSSGHATLRRLLDV